MDRAWLTPVHAVEVRPSAEYAQQQAHKAQIEDVEKLARDVLRVAARCGARAAR